MADFVIVVADVVIVVIITIAIYFIIVVNISSRCTFLKFIFS